MTLSARTTGLRQRHVERDLPRTKGRVSSRGRASAKNRDARFYVKGQSLFAVVSTGIEEPLKAADDSGIGWCYRSRACRAGLQRRLERVGRPRRDARWMVWSGLRRARSSGRELAVVGSRPENGPDLRLALAGADHREGGLALDVRVDWSTRVGSRWDLGQCAVDRWRLWLDGWCAVGGLLLIGGRL